MTRTLEKTQDIVAEASRVAGERFEKTAVQDESETPATRSTAHRRAARRDWSAESDPGAGPRIATHLSHP